MGEDLGINIISTEMDLELLTNKKYHKKVCKALKKVKECYDITNHSVACHEDYIAIFDQQKHLIVIEVI